VPYWGAEWVNWMAARLRRAREREESMSGKRVVVVTKEGALPALKRVATFLICPSRSSVAR